MHALPLTYNKDLQEDKEHLFDAVDTLELALAAAQADGGRRDVRPRRLAEAAGDELIAATDVADLLVKRGLPFREAHGVVAAPCEDCDGQWQSFVGVEARRVARTMRPVRPRPRELRRPGADLAPEGPEAPAQDIAPEGSDGPLR